MPGIIRVMWLHASQLSPHMAEKHIAGVPVAVGSTPNEIAIIKDASAKGVTAYENNGLICRATLEFSTSDEVPKDEDIVWLVQDADETWWLIGTKERNFPVTEVTRSAGSPGGEPAVATVKVSYSGLVALIPVAL